MGEEMVVGGSRDAGRGGVQWWKCGYYCIGRWGLSGSGSDGWGEDAGRTVLPRGVDALKIVRGGVTSPDCHETVVATVDRVRTGVVVGGFVSQKF